MIRWCLITLTLLSGCTPRRPQAPEALYEKARLEIRRGNFDLAWAQADLGFRQWRAEPNTLWYWQFHLLRAEILLLRGKAKDAQSLLDAKIPDRPEFGELVARKGLHPGRAPL